MDEENQKKGYSAVDLVIKSIFPILLLLLLRCFFMFLPGYLRAKEQCNRTQCQCNLKNIAEACEMYAVDNNGYYPDSLSKIAPNYIPLIPTYPNAWTDTYSGTYSVNNKKVYQLKFILDGKTYYNYDINSDSSNYSFYCKGANHVKMDVGPPNFPKYSQKKG